MESTVTLYVERDSVITLSGTSYNYVTNWEDNYGNSGSMPQDSAWSRPWTVNRDLVITFTPEHTSTEGAWRGTPDNLTVSAPGELPFDTENTSKAETVPFSFPEAGTGNWYKKVSFSDEQWEKSTWTVEDVVETVNGNPMTDFTLSYSTTGGIQTGTILMMNTKDRPTETSVIVSKAWNNADGTAAWPDNVTVEATLYKSVGGGTPVAVTVAELETWHSAVQTTPVTLSSGTPSATWDKLPLKDNSDNDITYSVTETAVKYNDTAAAMSTEDGVTTYTVNGRIYDSITTVSGSTTAITNTERTKLLVKKAWRRNGAAEATWPTGAVIYYTVEQIATFTPVGGAAIVTGAVDYLVVDSAHNADKALTASNFTTGVWIEGLKRQERVTLNAAETVGGVNVPAGTYDVTYTYRVKESASSIVPTGSLYVYSEITAEASQGTGANAGKLTATLTNDLVDVTVNKTWTTVPSGTWSAEFTLQKAQASTENWQDVAGAASIVISNTNPSATVTNLPKWELNGATLVELQYRVVETNVTVNGEDKTVDYAAEVIPGTSSNSYVIAVNNAPDTSHTALTVEKTWVNGTAADAEITVTLGRYKLVRITGTLTISDPDSSGIAGGSVAYTISGGDYSGTPVSQLTGTVIPAGTYTITKTVTYDSSLYTASDAVQTDSVTITNSGETATATFTATTLTRKTGTLTISDSQIGLTSGTYSASYHVTGPNGYDNTVTGNGAVINNLPTGQYTVVKTVPAHSGFTTTFTSETQTANVTTEGGSVTFTQTVFEEGAKEYVTVTVKHGNYILSTICSGYNERSIEKGEGLSIVISSKGVPEVRHWDADNSAANYDNLQTDVECASSDQGENGFTIYYFTISNIQTNRIVGIKTNDWQNDAIVTVSVLANRSRRAGIRSTINNSITRNASRNITTSIPTVTPAENLTFTTSGSPLTVNGTTPNATAGYSKEMDSSWAQTVTLNSGNSWSAVVKGLEKADGSGNEYVYYIASVSETGVPTGTSAVIGSGVVYGNGGSGNTLTVTDTLPTTEISAHKDWQGTNPSGHPASVTFHLFADGSEVGSGLVANSGNSWTVSWDTLPYYNDSGNAITYSVTEDAVTDYELSSVTYASGTFGNFYDLFRHFYVPRQEDEDPKSHATVINAENEVSWDNDSWLSTNVDNAFNDLDKILNPDADVLKYEYILAESLTGSRGLRQINATVGMNDSGILHPAEKG